MVEFVLRVGEGEYDEMDATWTYVLDRVAIVVAERGDAAHVVTVYRVSSHSMNLMLTFDADVNALYVQFSERDVVETIQLAKGVMLDVDVDGEAVGLEILNAIPGWLRHYPPCQIP